MKAICLALIAALALATAADAGHRGTARTRNFGRNRTVAVPGLGYGYDYSPPVVAAYAPACGPAYGVGYGTGYGRRIRVLVPIRTRIGTIRRR